MTGESINQSGAIKLAASLPPEAPHILGVDTSEVADEQGVCAVIDIDEFEDALRDPKAQAFARKAMAYGRQLKAEDRTD